MGSGATPGVPACPTHPGSRVVMNGRYGGEHPRQRFRCIQPTGDKHNFAGTLARMVAEAAHCPTCGGSLSPHQWPLVAPRYDYPVEEIALALQRVGNQMSYTEAAQRSRAKTRGGRAINGQLVGNWVEVFAPVVAARYAEDTWPETVVLDSTSFKATTTSGYKEVFSILCAFGYDEGNHTGRALKIVASTRRNATAWRAVLRSKKGQPKLLVADKDTGILAGAFGAWPSVAWRRCHWHLHKNLDAQLVSYGIGFTKENPHPLAVLAQKAFKDLSSWRAFKAAAAAHGGSNLVSWIQGAEDDLLGEFSAEPLPPHFSNGAAEKVLNSIKDVIATRAFCYRNAERTNRMLELVRLRVNRCDHLRTYAEDIRAYLENGGALHPQLQIKDRRGIPSLR